MLRLSFVLSCVLWETSRDLWYHCPMAMFHTISNLEDFRKQNYFFQFQIHISMALPSFFSFYGVENYFNWYQWSQCKVWNKKSIRKPWLWLNRKCSEFMSLNSYRCNIYLRGCKANCFLLCLHQFITYFQTGLNSWCKETSPVPETKLHYKLFSLVQLDKDKSPWFSFHFPQLNISLHKP